MPLLFYPYYPFFVVLFITSGGSSKPKKTSRLSMLRLAGLSIDMADYIQQIQIQIAATIKESEKKLKEKR